MKWLKEFLKPNKWKIAIFLLIAIVTIISLVSVTFATPPCIPETPCFVGGEDLLFPNPIFLPGIIILNLPLVLVFAFLFQLGSTTSQFEQLFRLFAALVTLLITIAYWYFLACLIHLLVSKFYSYIRKLFVHS